MSDSTTLVYKKKKKKFKIFPLVNAIFFIIVAVYISLIWLIRLYIHPM